MFTEKKVPLQRYWTTRYVWTLVIGLFVIGIISVAWIRHQTMDNRLSMMQFVAEQTAGRLVNDGQVQPQEEEDVVIQGREDFMNMDSRPDLYVVDQRGTILFQDRPRGQRLPQRFAVDLLDEEQTIQKLDTSSGLFYMVSKPVEINDATVGWVILLESKENLTKVDQEYWQLFFILVCLALLGWLAIYFLSKRLSKPIQEVAQAAREVEAGNYGFHIDDERVKEAEIYDLIQSFQEMSGKLQHLEELRSQLLAGVTHELKTPVTSISGMLRAVQDGIVEEEEAEDFIRVSLKETEKLERMVLDLLSFNTFAANSVPLTKEIQSVNRTVKESVHHWEVGQEKDNLSISVDLLSEDVDIPMDSMRFQQIITNLLNNASHAIEGKGDIYIRMDQREQWIYIDVEDTGGGIKEEERDFIFERFYRGEEKKYKTGGLGLGLPFSKMIAQSLGGDLVLFDSSSAGTTFRIQLPIH
ncbi:HAMP domain-containing sensor histidine kinase [Halobacillus sp. ACCC02827]|uniref:HAMP domain-containing sensor histidine kinase n=1 Tax=Halobacillus sp. ACCC02827 TaxID=3052090 RepID=UPI0025711909|nr:HAMP domain-containing sensor histidine kinase [Halobacillus sp. ACCC02827]WJE16283.1 HAMP domain-containing sensor histidine kinase [Halobacillus sp. ACCC02827]